ncbi:hypothetical protein JVT61DRAFT_11448 [Boletus reticuloceps]|uniref:Uncharacterized protein n=1 Tax=Boletus reticuloceps TaxID=495285 RepID=A0A8I2YTP5_9AGAM|nr:hypothetical protein JVT61DRAFT_11448 [Boletus reticuloceps]
MSLAERSHSGTASLFLHANSCAHGLHLLELSALSPLHYPTFLHSSFFIIHLLSLQIPDFAGPDYDIIHQGLISGYQENEQQVVERLIVAWEAGRNTHVAEWNLQREAEARAAEDAEQEHRLQEEDQERISRRQVKAKQKEAEKKKPKMNTFALDASTLKSFDFIELWYFTPTGRSDAAKYSTTLHTDDILGISRTDNLLMELLPRPRQKGCVAEIQPLATFFWHLETHPILELPLGEKIILTYASCVHFNWHTELKAGRGYNISILNKNLISFISDKVHM